MIQPKPANLDLNVENQICSLLVKEYSKEPQSYINMLMDIESIGDRFQYLSSVTGPGLFAATTTVLCSGFSVGSEMISARQYGFGAIHGVEVDDFLVDVCKKRLAYMPDMYPIGYDGDYLPYEDNQFDLVTSGHVIEHTRSPKLYLKECMRVLVPGGFLSLEFPDRNNKIELHTGLRSYERLPRPVRNLVLRFLSSKFSSLPAKDKSKYALIVESKLQQISLGSVRRNLRRAGWPFRILDVAVPAQGIIRCVIQKAA